MNANNVVLLRGRVSSEPRVRELPSGSAIVNLEVTTLVDDVSVSVPVVVGTVRRRFFRAGGATQSRTEVLADKVVRASRTRAVQKLVESVVLVLEAA